MVVLAEHLFGLGLPIVCILTALGVYRTLAERVAELQSDCIKFLLCRLSILILTDLDKIASFTLFSCLFAFP